MVFPSSCGFATHTLTINKQFLTADIALKSKTIHLQHGYTRQHRGIDFIAELSPDVEGRVYIYTAENTSAANGMTITTLNTDPLYKVNCVQPILYGVSGEDGIYYSHQTGRKKYEIKNHLGNVHLVVSDKKVGQDSLGGQSGDGIIDHYTTINTDYYHYYPFAWFIQDRNFNLNGVDLGAYRFSFNGMEKDDEIDGVTGSKLDFGARIYDSRIGRWLSVDPSFLDYPQFSVYCAFGLNPIRFMDNNGKDIWDPRRKEKVVYNSKTGLFKTESGKDVSKWFTKNSLPVLEAMTSTEIGLNRIERMQNMPTRIKIKTKKGIIGADGYGDTYGFGRVTGDDGKEYYKKATMTVYPNIIKDPNARWGGIGQDGENQLQSLEQGIGATGTHESGHLEPENIMLDEQANITGNKADRKVAEAYPTRLENDFMRQSKGKDSNKFIKNTKVYEEKK